MFGHFVGDEGVDWSGEADCGGESEYAGGVFACVDDLGAHARTALVPVVVAGV